MTRTEQLISNIEAQWTELVERNMRAQQKIIEGLPRELVVSALETYRKEDPLGPELDALEEELRLLCPEHDLLPENFPYE